jgi:hypothetical protein
MPLGSLIVLGVDDMLKRAQADARHEAELPELVAQISELDVKGFVTGALNATEFDRMVKSVEPIMHKWATIRIHTTKRFLRKNEDRALGEW